MDTIWVFPLQLLWNVWSEVLVDSFGDEGCEGCETSDEGEEDFEEGIKGMFRVI
jgi:hypothetical protein